MGGYYRLDREEIQMEAIVYYLVRKNRVTAVRRSKGKKARAGWYYDPQKQARYRRWDGERWTDETAARLPRSNPPAPD